jgi:L-threonylcarbamoyladenylate synthase
LSTSDDDLSIAASALREGRLVALPTETVYGLGANALDGAAVARIFEAKNRPHFDPLIVHVAGRAQLDTVVDAVPALAEVLIDAFWPGPLTLILPRAAIVPSLVTSGLETVAVRRPSHPVAAALIDRAGVPVAAPSANPFGRLSPTRADHVVQGLGDAVDFIVDGGPSVFGVESTIVDASDDRVARVLRHGAISAEEIAAVVGADRVEIVAKDTVATPTGPGQLEQHYAPRTRLVPSRGQHVPDSENVAYLAFDHGSAGDETLREAGYVAVETLSPSGDLKEAASRLFDVLHRLDACGADVIYFEWAPDTGVGRAINDRLRRAAATFS